MCCILSVNAQTANCDLMSRISRTTIRTLTIFKLDVQQNRLQTITVAQLVTNLTPSTEPEGSLCLHYNKFNTKYHKTV